MPGIQHEYNDVPILRPRRDKPIKVVFSLSVSHLLRQKSHPIQIPGIFFCRDKPINLALSQILWP